MKYICIGSYGHSDTWMNSLNITAYKHCTTVFFRPIFSCVFHFSPLNCSRPPHQDTILRIFLIGLSKNLPCSGRDTLDMAELLIKRAAATPAIEADDFREEAEARNFAQNSKI